MRVCVCVCDGLCMQQTTLSLSIYITEGVWCGGGGCFQPLNTTTLLLLRCTPPSRRTAPSTSCAASLLPTIFGTFLSASPVRDVHELQKGWIFRVGYLDHDQNSPRVRYILLDRKNRGHNFALKIGQVVSDGEKVGRVSRDRADRGGQ